MKQRHRFVLRALKEPFVPLHRITWLRFNGMIEKNSTELTDESTHRGNRNSIRGPADMRKLSSRVIEGPTSVDTDDHAGADPVGAVKRKPHEEHNSFTATIEICLGDFGHSFFRLLCCRSHGLRFPFFGFRNQLRHQALQRFRPRAAPVYPERLGTVQVREHKFRNRLDKNENS